MLLRFSVTNHLSIRDEFNFLMVAAKLNDYPDGLISSPLSGIDVVPAALIYGPNASGKSNIISALSFMQSTILNSQVRAKPEEEIGVQPFALSPATLTEPSCFEADFILNGIRYQYGFSLDSREVKDEWLQAYPYGRAQQLFRRERQNFSFGRKLKGRNTVIADLTRRNSLFLSAAAQNDHDELTPIYKFFSSIQFIQSLAFAGMTVSQEFERSVVDKRVINFLKNIGTGVVSYRKKEVAVGESLLEMRTKFLAAIKSALEYEGEVPDLSKEVSIELGHKASNGEVVFFELDRESSGTRRLLVMLSKIFETLDRGGLIIIDELDASLHTQACELIFGLFSDKQYNRNGGQLIATVHDTNLLKSEFIRRDQVWLCQKDEGGASHFTPLTDIKLRHTDDFEKGYLQGRFESLPFSGNLKEMITSGRITSGE